MKLKVNIMKEIAKADNTVFNEVTTVTYDNVNGITYEEIDNEMYFVIWHRDNERSSFKCKTNYITFL